MRSGPWDVRRAAAIEPLWRLIRDPDEEIREHAVKAIRLIKEESTR